MFGVALDSDTANRTPNIYVTRRRSTGCRSSPRTARRLVKGEPGARWMPGQFGVDKGGGPGSIWKIDGATGAVSLFANIKHDGKDNAGPGLGGIAYDPAPTSFSSPTSKRPHPSPRPRRQRQGHVRPGITGRAKAGLEPSPTSSTSA